jgi:hypothetical protein
LANLSDTLFPFDVNIKAWQESQCEHAEHVMDRTSQVRSAIGRLGSAAGAGRPPHRFVFVLPFFRLTLRQG